MGIGHHIVNEWQVVFDVLGGPVSPCSRYSEDLDLLLGGMG